MVVVELTARAELDYARAGVKDAPSSTESALLLSHACAFTRVFWKQVFSTFQGFQFVAWMIASGHIVEYRYVKQEVHCNIRVVTASN